MDDIVVSAQQFATQLMVRKLENITINHILHILLQL